MKINKLQIVIVACSVVLFVLLFIANKKPVKKAEEMPQQANQEALTDVKVFVDAQISMLSDSVKNRYLALEKVADDTSGLNNLIAFFNEHRMPLALSYYFEKKAQKANTPTLWYDGGNRYFYAIRFIKDKNEAQACYQSAMRCYFKALELKPSYTEAKIQLASCYVEGSAEPMKGITMLKELEKADSANIQVQMVLAAFAVKSGQTDKAIARYQKVLKLKPDYLEAYLFLADAYEKNGDKAKTIETLEKYVSLTPDKEIKEEIKKYINQLKTNV